MDSLYRESRPVLPRNLACLAAVVLVATLAFIVFSRYVLSIEIPSLTILVTAVVFTAIIILLMVLRMDVEVNSECVRINHMLRKMEFGRQEILEVHTGDLTEIRNYGNWNLKEVKHKSYTRVGDDEGVALKLTEKRLVMFSSEAPANEVEVMLIADLEPA